MANKAFGKRLRWLRDRTIMRQEDAANELGVARSTYTKYETGESEPDHEMVAKLAALYGVTIDYLMGYTATTDVSADADQIEVIRNLPNWHSEDEVNDFVEWVKENVGDTFFADFKNTPDERKRMLKQFMADQRTLWEMEKKGEDS